MTLVTVVTAVVALSLHPVAAAVTLATLLLQVQAKSHYFKVNPSEWATLAALLSRFALRVLL